MKTKLAEFFETYTDEHLKNLFYVSAAFERTGVVPEDSEIRKIAKSVFDEDTAITMTFVVTGIYKEIATRVVQHNHNKNHFLS